MKSAYLSTALLTHLFLGGPSPLGAGGQLYLSLHSKDPGADGKQDTDEVSYAGYERYKLSNEAGAWSLDGNTIAYAKAIQFPICLGGEASVACLCVGMASEGAGEILYRARLGTTVTYSKNKVPIIAPMDLRLVEV